MQNIRNNDVNSQGEAVCFSGPPCALGQVAAHPDLVGAALTEAYEAGHAKGRTKGYADGYVAGCRDDFVRSYTNAYGR